MKLRHAAALALVNLTLALVSQDSRGETVPILNKIEIRGNHRISEQAIRAHISSSQGQPFNVAAVDSDIKAIYHMGAFTRVRSRLQRKGNQEILVILVDEKSMPELGQPPNT